MSSGRLSKSVMLLKDLSLPDDKRKAKGDKFSMQKMFFAMNAVVAQDSYTAVPESIGILPHSNAMMSETG